MREAVSQRFEEARQKLQEIAGDEHQMDRLKYSPDKLRACLDRF